LNWDERRPLREFRRIVLRWLKVVIYFHSSFVLAQSRETRSAQCPAR
jgi:hypothetical protein